MNIDVTRESLEGKAQKKLSSVLFNIQNIDEEWRFWALLIENFSDEQLHAAYLGYAAKANQLPVAARRYREYYEKLRYLDNAMSDLRRIDKMLVRIQAVSIVQLNASKPAHVDIRPYSALQRLLFFLVGFVLLGLLSYR